MFRSPVIPSEGSALAWRASWLWEAEGGAELQTRSSEKSPGRPHQGQGVLRGTVPRASVETSQVEEVLEGKAEY